MITSMCKKCLNFRSTGIILACDAFPDGIPLRILRGDEGHVHSIKGDNGYIFRDRSTELYKRFVKITPVLRALDVRESDMIKLRIACTINRDFSDLPEHDKRAILAAEKIAEKLASGEVKLQDLLDQTEPNSA